MVVTFGSTGALHVLDFKSGQKIWSADIVSRFATKPGIFGFACSPLIEEDKLKFSIGEADRASIVALSVDSGKLLWKSTNHDVGYESGTFSQKQVQAIKVFGSNLFLDSKKARGKALKPWSNVLSPRISE